MKKFENNDWQFSFLIDDGTETIWYCDGEVKARIPHSKPTKQHGDILKIWCHVLQIAGIAYLAYIAFN